TAQTVGQRRPIRSIPAREAVRWEITGLVKESSDEQFPAAAGSQSKHIGIVAADPVTQREPVCPVPASHLIHDEVACQFERTADMKLVVDKRERAHWSTHSAAQRGPIGSVPARDVAGWTSIRRIKIPPGEHFVAAYGDRPHEPAAVAELNSVPQWPPA